MVQHSSFVSSSGVEEHFFAATAISGSFFEEEAAALLAAYDAALRQAGCGEDTSILLRFHLSDVTNQAGILRSLLAGRREFISVVGQPPAAGARIALEAWHWKGGRPVRRLRGGTLDLALSHYRVFLHQLESTVPGDSLLQTEAEFASLETALAEHDGNVEANTQRTWLYCRDVDNHYAGLVRGRNEYFALHGLNRDTHYIASTGIGAEMPDPKRLIKMDSINFFGLAREQITYLAAPEFLSPTQLYGVAFERGTRLVFGDRSHCYISGTASIDHEGKVVHLNDVRRQTRRMLENIRALLAAGGATLDDLRQATVYLRDPADAGIVMLELRSVLGDELPMVILKAPVCRPTWLVEVECIAVNAGGDARFAPLR